MLISTLKKTLFTSGRPAPRRGYVAARHMEDLEPRLFLSVNSLLAAETAEEDAAESPETEIDAIIDAEMTSFESWLQDSTGDTATYYSSGDSYFNGPTAWAANPHFANAYITTNPYGYLAAGTVAWDGYPYGLYGIPVKFYDGPDLVGMAYSQYNGMFTLYNAGHAALDFVLIHPQTGETADYAVVVAY